jgi:putative hydrolase of HD superfamily
MTTNPPQPPALRDETDAVVQVARLSLAFGRVDRLTYHEDGTTRESDTDHTVMLGLIACAFAARHPDMGLDVGLVAQYALVHDLPEVYAGDTPTLRALGADAAREKEAREHAAWQQIERETKALPWVASAIAEYESRAAPEARYVKAMDKVLPKLTHILNGGVCVREGGMSLTEVASRYAEQDDEIRRYAADFPLIFDLRAELIGDLLNRLRTYPEVLASREVPATLLEDPDGVPYPEEVQSFARDLMGRPDFDTDAPWIQGLVTALESVARPYEDGMSLIRAERRRQVEVEGYTAEHDAEHGSWALLQAGLAYELDGAIGAIPGAVPERWPWAREFWKPRDPISNLIRAGALYLAAADQGRDTTARVQRCAGLIDAARAALTTGGDRGRNVDELPAWLGKGHDYLTTDMGADAGGLFPFVEDENCNITGRGHQDKATFAAEVNRYDAYCNAEPVEAFDQWTASDVSHAWVRVRVLHDDERLHPCEPTDEGAFPVTTLWGAR